MVYFAESPCGRFIKIGFSSDPARRMSTLNSSDWRYITNEPGKPLQFRLLGLLQGSYLQEQELHQKFNGNHHRGEWFHSTDELRLFIKTNSIAGFDYKASTTESTVRPDPVTVTLRISAALHKRARIVLLQEGQVKTRTMSELVEDLLTDWLASRS